MKPLMLAAAALSLSLLPTVAVAGGWHESLAWCRYRQNPDDPMVWGEGYGLSSCNDRADGRYGFRPELRVRNFDDPMVWPTSKWRFGVIHRYDRRYDSRADGRYDPRYDDRYDRRFRRYR